MKDWFELISLLNYITSEKHKLYNKWLVKNLGKFGFVTEFVFTRLKVHFYRFLSLKNIQAANLARYVIFFNKSFKKILFKKISMFIYILSFSRIFYLMFTYNFSYN